MLRILFAFGPVAIIVGVIAVWAQASDLPVAHRVAAEICHDPGITAAGLGARFRPRQNMRHWELLNDERPIAWLHRRFLGTDANNYWIVAKSRSDAGRLARVWVDIGTVDETARPITLVSASFDGGCRLLDAESH